jgi:poly-gamma-glutamate capsule biosynthesis protein CapA/YwtB (metallophosphatase superfamily)
MRQRYGWGLEDEYGWFVTTAASVLGVAFLALLIAHGLAARYQWKVAGGSLNPPALRSVMEDQPVPVLGASIGDVPSGTGVQALAAALKVQVKDLPWERALVRRNASGDLIAIDSIFIPTADMAEAFAMCAKLAHVPPGCAPVIASTDQLRTANGKTVGESELEKYGITPYVPSTSRWSRTASIAPPTTKVVYVHSPPKIIYVPGMAPPAKVVYLPGKAPPPQIIYRTAQAPPPKIVYVPAKAPEPKVVYLPAPAPKAVAPVVVPAPVAPTVTLAANTQAPLRLQPGIRVDGRAPSTQFWLSAAYKPGDARLTSVAAAGDLMMGTIGNLNPAIRPGTNAAELVGSDLAGVFQRADVGFLNLEGPLYDGAQGTGKSCANCFAFHSPTYYADVLRTMGIDAVSLANNHSGDYGEAGRNSTMAALRKSGIVYAGLDRDDARTAIMVLPSGKKVGLIAFAPNNGTLNLNNIPRAVELVADLKKTTNIVLVSFHGGAEGWAYVHVSKSSEYFVGENRGDVTRFAHAVIDAGADLVIGQGPHVPRAVEVYKGHLIAYSLGNFWTYSGVQTYAVSGLGPVLEAWLTPDGNIAGFSLHSTRQAGLGVPRLDPMGEAGRYVLYLTKSDFPGTASLLAGAGKMPALAANAEGGPIRPMAGSGS